MEISRIGVLPPPVADAGQTSDVAARFDAMFYRLLLQTTQWSSGVAGASKADHALMGSMVSDVFAQEAARQQSVFGAMLINSGSEAAQEKEKT